MEHELKTWPFYFDLMWRGAKTFELRRDDRPYANDDTLCLREWDPDLKDYTRREIRAIVLLALRGGVIPDGYCAMQIFVMDVRTGGAGGEPWRS